MAKSSKNAAAAKTPHRALNTQGAAAPSAYQVLARKYRPQRFEDLIGQEAMVTTLTNAFATGRIAHAFMLTGVRGVGKTTTARLLARALNYKSATADAPSITLDPPGELCTPIAEGRHPDVLEMDAASRTGVNDIRDILDGVGYAPSQARFKVYVIDEVHMLSTSAFNALLKTLEEPPAHAKFIFATTEIRKVPVTVLSRCQRFDLKRVPADRLMAHLADVAGKEGMAVAEDGLALIARAAEGSVRDALSLLDQALVQGGSGQVDAGAVRDMLGLADRAATFALFADVMAGKTAHALDGLAAQYHAGADPVVVMRDLLDHCHAVTRAKTLGDKAVFSDAADFVAELRSAADGAAMGALTRMWQMLLKAHEETRAAPDAMAAAEMALIRISHAAGLPPPEDAARLLAGQGGAHAAQSTAASHAEGPPVEPPRAMASGGQSAPPAPRTDPAAAALPLASSAPAARTEPNVAIRSLADVAALAEQNRDLLLKSEIERGMRPVQISAGSIVYQPTDVAADNLSAKVAAALLSWTGARWLVTADAHAQGGSTLAEDRAQAQAERLAAVKADPAVATALDLWPGAEIVSIADLGDTDTDDDTPP